MVIKKGSAVGAVVVLMLCVAVYLNWSYTKTPDDALTAASDAEAGKILGQAQLVENMQDEDAESAEGENGEATEKQDDSGYFARARLTRQRARDEAMSILKETAADEKVEQLSREKAGEELTAMASAAVRESRIENLIVAKGYEDCVVSIGTDSVTIVVKSPEGGLTDQDAAKIQDIVIGETSATSDQIKIIETY